ncbi:retrovirus-related pol polyprotein from transposon TNT 1-94 [Tanacetum coccineum]
MMASSPICLLSKASKTKSWLWHRRLSHLNFGAINHLARHGLVRGLPKLKFEKDHLCSACALGKSSKKPHKPKSEDTNQEKLYLLHMDLCGPMRVASVNGKKYILVIVDDYSQFTWVKCLRSKDEALVFIINFLKMIQVRLKETVASEQIMELKVTSDQSSSSDVIHTIVPPDHQFYHTIAKCKPKNYKDALTQACGIEAMQRKLHEFERLEVWELCSSSLIKNLSSLLIVFALGARFEAIRIFIAFARSYEHGPSIKLDGEDAFLNVDTPCGENPKWLRIRKGKLVDPSHYRGPYGMHNVRLQDPSILDIDFTSSWRHVEMIASVIILKASISKDILVLSREFSLDSLEISKACQVDLDDVYLTPSYKAIPSLTVVPEIYMQIAGPLDIFKCATNVGVMRSLKNPLSEGDSAHFPSQSFVKHPRQSLSFFQAQYLRGMYNNKKGNYAYLLMGGLH